MKKTSDEDTYTEQEARQRLKWQYMGQEGNVKTHRLLFSDSDGATMTYASVESYDGGRTWKAIDRGGDIAGDARKITEAKKIAADAAVKVLAQDGYIKDTNADKFMPAATQQTPVGESQPPLPPTGETQSLPGAKPEAPAVETANAKEPWEMTKAEWDRLRKEAGKAELKALRAFSGSPEQKKHTWGTIERIRLEYGVEAQPIRKGGAPIVTHEAVIRKALSEGKPVPAEVLADYPDTAPSAPIFIRKTTRRERIGGTARSKGFNTFPDKEGFEKVYMPYGEQGPGYYYAPLKLRHPALSGKTKAERGAAVSV